MSEPDSAPSGDPDHSILAAFRARMLSLMAVVGVLLLTPFALYNLLVAGNVVLGILGIALIAIFAITALAIRKNKSPPIPLVLLLPLMATTLALVIRHLGLLGVFWAFPAILFCYFSLPRRIAHVAGALLTATAAIATYIYVPGGLEVTVRIVATLASSIGIVTIMLEVVERLQTELVGQALIDPLTGAYNRRQLDVSLAEAIERNRRSGAPASILMIDIDHFKKVNDDFGHPVGDKVLKGLAALIKGRARKLDRLFRVGGEEFVLLLPDTPANAAMKQAEALRKLTSESQLVEQRLVTISIGVAEYWAEQTQETWMQAADAALYQAKAAGRNTVMLGSADSESIPGLSETGEKRYDRAAIAVKPRS